MQYVARDIADAFIARGYNVYFELSLGIEDEGCSKKKLEFNPHVTININHFNNLSISDDVFNFVWFQDNMPMLTNNEDIHKRERDFSFVYHSMYRELLIKKDFPKNKIFDQKIIPVNTSLFYLDENIKREDKVVFVGTYYKNGDYFEALKESIDTKITTMVEEGISLSQENLQSVLNNDLLSNDKEFIDYIQQKYQRNITVSWLCDSAKEIEIYGYNWEESGDKNIIKNFKGLAEKSKLNTIYNSAKYAVSASGSVINTQRLGEIIHAGAIPIMYDSRELTDEVQTWDDECLYFKTKKELMYILDNNILPKKYRSKKMLEHFTYNSFMDTILNIVQDTTEINK
jgi:hypothetical protein